MNNNSNGLIIGIIAGLALGGVGGYVFGQKGVDKTTSVAEIQQMTDMMKADGAQMEKMGAFMVESGTLIQSKATTYKDEELLTKGKDLVANGTKHQVDGKSMMGSDMMGMTSGGNMGDMGGMKM